jgi:hypothetical protein
MGRGEETHAAPLPEVCDGILTDKPKPAAGYVCEMCHWETAELPASLGSLSRSTA